MKRKCALLLLSACLLFAACGGTGNSSAQSASAATEGKDAPQTVQPETQLEMQMAMTPGTSSEVAGNNDGAYYIWTNSQDTSALTLYYDYASRQLVHLSNQVIPTNDEENPGWIEDVYGGVAPLAVNGKFYVLKYGKAPIPSVQYEGSPSLLLEMEPNAANRRSLTLPGELLFMTYSGIAADGEELYLLLSRYDSSTMQMTEALLCRTDFDAGKMETLCTFDTAEKDAAVIGVYSDGIVLQRSSFSGAAASSALEQLSCELQLYSVLDGSLSDTGFCWNQGDLTFVLDGSTVYFVRSGETALRAYDLMDQTETVLTEQILETTDTPPESEVRLMGQLHDGHVLFVVTEQETSAYYSYNVSDGTVLPMQLSYSYVGAEVPVLIVSESERYFLVNSGKKTLQRAAYGTDGSYYTMTSDVQQYALMEKSDYWNSVPNYLGFNDELLDQLAASGA